MERKITTPGDSCVFPGLLKASAIFVALMLFNPSQVFSQSKSRVGNSVAKSAAGDPAWVANTPKDGNVNQGSALIPKWTIQPIDRKIFIENKGQFNYEVKKENIKKVLYQVVFPGDVKGYFTANGVLYRNITFVVPKVKKDKEEDNDKDRNGAMDPDALKVPVEHSVGVTWEGSSPNVTIEAGEEQSYPYIYSTIDNKTIKANVFKKITYTNLYPGIDVEYIFPGDGKDGIKYTIIVHPGADLSKVKLKYSNVKGLTIDELGNVEVQNDMGAFTDHTPVSSYREGGVADVEYVVNGDEESFRVKGNYDKTKTLVIDPWTTTINYAGLSYNNSGYGVDYDNAGNVYVACGFNPFQIAKYNSSGVFQWYYNCFTADTATSDWQSWGDFAVDKRTGTCYIGEAFNYWQGAWVEKVNTKGIFVSRWNGGGSAEFREIWRMQFNVCSGQIAIGGGGTNPNNDDQVAVLDTTMTSLSPANPLGVTGPGHDVCLMATDPVGSACYMAVVQSSWYNNGTGYTGPDQRNIDNNVVFEVPLPALTPLTWAAPGYVSDGYAFSEGFGYTSPTFVGPPTPSNTSVDQTLSMNGMAVSPNYIYMYDGKTLTQRSKTTGALLNSLNTGGTAFSRAGLAADACDNVFVGEGTTVKEYSSTFATVSTTSGLPNTIYALTMGLNGGELYASGKNFVEEFTNPKPIATVTVTPTSTTCGLNNGSATANLSLACTIPGTVNYSWSPGGQTTQTVNGLASGTYTCTMSFGCGASYQVTATIGTSTTPTITVTPNPSFTVCSGSSVTLTASGGTGYTWSPGGATTSSITVSTTGGWTVTPTGCGNPVSGNVTVNPTPTVTVSALPSATVCTGSSVALSASGGGAGATYAWTPAGSLTNTTADTTTASPSASTIYSVTVTGSDGCSAAQQTIPITVNPSPTITVAAAPSATICSGTDTHLTVSGGGVGTTYTWGPSTGLTNTTADTTTASPAVSTTYTVSAVAAGGCFNSNSTQTIAINVNTTPTVVVTPNPVALCPGDSVNMKVTGAGGASGTYAWSPSTGLNNTNTDSVWAKPASSVTYTVTSANGACPGNTVTIPVTVGTLTVTITSSSGSTLCSGLTDTLKGGGATTYSWSTGATTTSIVINPSSTGTYSVLGTSGGSGCKDSATFSLTVNPTPTITAAAPSPGTVCPGDTTWAAVNVTGAGTPPYSFSWNTAPVQTTDTAIALMAGTYTVIVKDANGCVADTGIVTINTQNIVVGITSSSASICGGDSAMLFGTGATSYFWSTGATTDTIMVHPTTDTTFMVVGKTTGKCKDSNTVTIKVNPKPIITVTAVSDSICAGSKTVITASGAAGGYTWSPSTGLNKTTGSPVTANPASNTWYTVTGLSAAGCPDTTGILISVVATPTVSIKLIGPDTICPGKSVTMVASGSAGSSFVWKPGGSTSAVNIVKPVTSPSTYTVVNSNGVCTDSAMQTIYIYPPLNLTMKSIDSTCSGNTTIIGAVVTGGKPAYNYVWNPSPGGSGPGPFVISPTVPVTYSLTVTDACGSSASGSTSVVISSSPVAAFEPSPETVLGGQYVAFVDNSTNASKWYWTFGDGGTSTASFPYYVYNVPGNYVVTLWVTSAAGCRDSITDTVTVIEEIYIPNVFTPNGDGVNDVFHVTTGSIKTYSIEIYSRWGQRVFASTNPNDDWTGRSEAGVMESDGTYYYLILATDYAGKNFKYTGYLQLIGGAGEAGN